METTNKIIEIAAQGNLNTVVDSSVDAWNLIISVVTPTIIWLIAKYVPKVPKMFLPALTPAVGVLLGMLLNWLADLNMGFIEMGKAGALAVFVRETVNQGVKAYIANQAAAAAKSEPEPVKPDSDPKP